MQEDTFCLGKWQELADLALSLYKGRLFHEFRKYVNFCELAEIILLRIKHGLSCDEMT